MKKLLALLLSLVMMAAIAAGCNNSTAPQETDTDAAPAQGKDTLRVAMASDASSMDMAGAIDCYSQTVYCNIYETLVTLDDQSNVVPNLAEFEQTGEKDYRFTIKQGVKFHNGEELKASDVVFTFKRGCESSVLNYIFSNIDPETIVATDDYTVELSLKTASATFLTNLTTYAAGIVNEKAVTEAGDAYAMNPVGTGPYKFVKWEKGVSVELEAFDGYHGEPAKVKNVIIRPVPEATNRTIELESGNVDISIDIPETDVNRVRDADDLVLLDTVANSITFMGFNCEVAPFDDIRVRQAVCHAIDAEGVVQAVKQGYCTLATTPVSKNLMFFDDSVQHISYDVTLAKQLLAEAGYPDGFEMTILADERKERVDVATIIQNQLADVGITVRVESMEWAAFPARVYDNDCQAFVLGWSSAVPDPDMVCYSLFHSSMIGGGNNNICCYNNPAADEYLDTGRSSNDTAVRAEAYSKLYKLLAEEVPMDYFWVDSRFVGLASDVEGFVMDPMSVYSFHGVYFK